MVTLFEFCLKLSEIFNSESDFELKAFEQLVLTIDPNIDNDFAADYICALERVIEGLDAIIYALRSQLEIHELIFKRNSLVDVRSHLKTTALINNFMHTIL